MVDESVLKAWSPTSRVVAAGLAGTAGAFAMSYLTSGDANLVLCVLVAGAIGAVIGRFVAASMAAAIVLGGLAGAGVVILLLLVAVYVVYVSSAFR